MKDPKWVRDTTFPKAIHLSAQDQENMQWLIAWKVVDFLGKEFRDLDYEIISTGHQIGIFVPVVDDEKKIARYMKFFLSVECISVLDDHLVEPQKP